MSVQYANMLALSVVGLLYPCKCSAASVGSDTLRLYPMWLQSAPKCLHHFLPDCCAVAQMGPLQRSTVTRETAL